MDSDLLAQRIAEAVTSEAAKAHEEAAKAPAFSWDRYQWRIKAEVYEHAAQVVLGCGSEQGGGG